MVLWTATQANVYPGGWAMTGSPRLLLKGGTVGTKSPTSTRNHLGLALIALFAGSCASLNSAIRNELPNAERTHTSGLRSSETAELPVQRPPTVLFNQVAEALRSQCGVAEQGAAANVLVTHWCYDSSLSEARMSSPLPEVCPRSAHPRRAIRDARHGRVR